MTPLEQKDVREVIRDQQMWGDRHHYFRNYLLALSAEVADRFHHKVDFILVNPDDLTLWKQVAERLYGGKFAHMVSYNPLEEVLRHLKPEEKMKQGWAAIAYVPSMKAEPFFINLGEFKLP